MTFSLKQCSVKLMYKHRLLGSSVKECIFTHKYKITLKLQTKTKEKSLEKISNISVCGKLKLSRWLFSEIYVHVYVTQHMQGQPTGTLPRLPKKLYFHYYSILHSTGYLHCYPATLPRSPLLWGRGKFNYFQIRFRVLLY